MDIFLIGNLPKGKDSGSTVKLQFNAIPEKIGMTAAGRFAEYDILDLGPVSIPNGNELSEYSWEGFLPGYQRKNEPWIHGEWIDPKTVQTYFSVWKSQGVKLKLLITGTPINHYVYLSEYEMEYSGAYGDYTYTVRFIDAREIDVGISTNKSSSSEKSQKRPTDSKSKKYKVKKGDTLWDISRDYYGSGSKYTKIYDANKSVIESTAKKHGKSSSQKGHWIYPGTVLVIP